MEANGIAQKTLRTKGSCYDVYFSIETCALADKCKMTSDNSLMS